MVQDNKNSPYKILSFDYLLVVGVFFCLYSYMITVGSSDLKSHMNSAISLKKNTIDYPPNFFYYGLLNLLTSSHVNKVLYTLMTVGVLTFTTFLKYYLSKRFIFLELTKSLGQCNKSHLTILTLCVFFCFAIPDLYAINKLNFWYVGRIVPFVLHNSTTIVLFPFCILLFEKQLSLFTKIENKVIFFVFFLIVLNAIIKPSFLIAYIPVTFLWITLSYFRKKKTFHDCLRLSTPVIVAGILIILEIILLYSFQQSEISDKAPKDGIAFSFLHVISRVVQTWYIPFAIFLSLLFPLALFLCYRDVVKYPPFLYSSILLLFSCIIAFTIHETGSREYHGNFFWQTYLCAYLIFMSSGIFLYTKIIENGITKIKNVFLIFIAFLHVISGIAYIVRFFIEKTYY